MKTPPKRKARHGQIRALTIKQLEQLTRDDLRALAEFAERRMDWLPSAPFSPEDMVHKALHSIIRGTKKGVEGRRPRLENLQSKEAFLHYVRSATNSVIEAAKRKRELWVIHETIHRQKDIESEQRLIVLTATPTADEDHGMVDLRNELFARLRKVAPHNLHATIDEWEKSFLWDTKVPFRRKRTHRDQVRRLAVQILKEIAEDLGP
jgi:hypothetical protein